MNAKNFIFLLSHWTFLDKVVRFSRKKCSSTIPMVKNRPCGSLFEENFFFYLIHGEKVNPLIGSPREGQMLMVLCKKFPSCYRQRFLWKNKPKREKISLTNAKKPDDDKAHPFRGCELLCAKAQSNSSSLYPHPAIR